MNKKIAAATRAAATWLGRRNGRHSGAVIFPFVKHVDQFADS